jgi:hypothetical protein
MAKSRNTFCAKNSSISCYMINCLGLYKNVNTNHMHRDIFYQLLKQCHSSSAQMMQH